MCLTACRCALFFTLGFAAFSSLMNTEQAHGDHQHNKQQEKYASRYDQILSFCNQKAEETNPNVSVSKGDTLHAEENEAKF